MDNDRKSKVPTEISVKRAANGGFIVRHSYDNYGGGPSYQPPKEHAFSDHKSMMSHLHQHTGGPKGKPGGSQISTENEDAGNEGAQTAQPHKSKTRPAHPGPRSRGAGMD